MSLRHLPKLVVILALLAGASAIAHERHAAPRDTSGVPIPSLSHGEMAVLENYRGTIFDLADSVRDPDGDFRTLLRYSSLEHSYCFWGLAPGTIADEQSPFNECAHAYLAAIKALLLRMRDMPSVRDRAGVLISEIDAEMALKGAAFIGCQYSGESFNSAEFVTPHWENLPGHPPSLYTLGGFLLLLASPAIVRLYAARRVSRPAG